MIYGRDVMLAVRNCLDRDATEKVTETIRLSLPAHLFSLIRRRALPNSAPIQTPFVNRLVNARAGLGP